jgi:hypothetical protein
LLNGLHVANRKKKPPVTAPASEPLSHERVIEAIASALSPEQAHELAREALTARLANSSVSELLGLATASRPHSLSTTAQTARREPKDYLGGIVDVTIVSKDKVRANAARVIMRDVEGRSYMWDATSAFGLALEPGQKKRITATVLGREGGHVKIHRVRFYDKSAKAPVRFTR